MCETVESACSMIVWVCSHTTTSVWCGEVLTLSAHSLSTDLEFLGKHFITNSSSVGCDLASASECDSVCQSVCVLPFSLQNIPAAESHQSDSSNTVHHREAATSRGYWGKHIKQPDKRKTFQTFSYYMIFLLIIS